MRFVLSLRTFCFCAISVLVCSSNQLPDSAAWHKIDAGAFSLLAPAGWEFHQLQGVDSYIGEFTGDGVVLKFDYGLWSNPLDEAHEPKYAITKESISGHTARIVW